MFYVLGDLKEFYQTPVSNSTPLDMMKNLDLPKNLHIQYAYNRFHPGKLTFNIAHFLASDHF